MSKAVVKQIVLYGGKPVYEFTENQEDPFSDTAGVENLIKPREWDGKTITIYPIIVQTYVDGSLVAQKSEKYLTGDPWPPNRNEGSCKIL